MFVEYIYYFFSIFYYIPFNIQTINPLIVPSFIIFEFNYVPDSFVHIGRLFNFFCIM
jgi:hypothetical protein